MLHGKVLAHDFDGNGLVDILLARAALTLALNRYDIVDKFLYGLGRVIAELGQQPRLERLVLRRHQVLGGFDEPGHPRADQLARVLLSIHRCCN